MALVVLATLVVSGCRRTENPDVSDERREAGYREIKQAITKSAYLEQRYAHRGASGPERMHNPLWEWAARYRPEPYQTNEEFGAPQENARPQWAFTRFGVSFTLLPDGRVLAIGGEHEDYYDPDFFIYNDVIVFQGASIAKIHEGVRAFRPTTAEPQIYAYSNEVFPPTDSHTATLVDGAIYIIGGLSYPDRRDPAHTPVYRLDTETLRIDRVETTGRPPGWIWNHTARRSADGGSILIRGGELTEGGREYTEPNERPWHLNLNDYKLDLRTGAWSLVVDRSDWVMRRTGDRYTSASSDAIAWLTDDVLRVEGFDVQIDPGLMAETSLVVDPRDEPLDYNWQDWMHPSCVEVVVDGHAFVWDRQRFGSYMYTDPTMPDELFQAYWVEGVAPKLKEAEDRALGLDEE